VIHEEPLLFELNPGLAEDYVGGVPAEQGIPAEFIRDGAPPLPELSELDVVRHFNRLSKRNAGVETHFYPLGSCTMKYNPRFNEDMAALPEVVNAHPLWDESLTQGCLEVVWETARWLAEISGFARVSLQPAAGAQSELGALMMVRAWHESRGKKPSKVLVTDTSHGTNPASAALCGFTVETLVSGPDGCIDLMNLATALQGDVAALMVTNPNTLGLFEPNMADAARMVHEAGGLVYFDGANMNALMGVARPAAFGADLMHFNLHKTFSTPHGGGGPGAGAIACTAELEPFLPAPLVARDAFGRFHLDRNRPRSIGKLTAFQGNFGVIVRALSYMVRCGGGGLREAAENAVLNANYLRKLLEPSLPTAYSGPCLHEFVLTARLLKKKNGVTALDIAKGLLDRGYYAPTIYFPLIVEEALMVEPTETEGRGTLDEFAKAFAEVCSMDPAELHSAPRTMPVGRLDEVKAARDMNLRWKP
jgi:glycine dehydrogenase subunit 2